MLYLTKNKSLYLIVSTLFMGEITQATAATGQWDCGTEVGKVTCTLAEDGTFTVSGTGQMKGYSGSEYQPWRTVNSSITNIIVEDGVTSVGREAFASLPNLQRADLAESVTTLDGWAFNSSGAREIYMPGVTTVGTGAFQYSPNLKSVYSPNVQSLGKSAFFQCTNLESVDLPKVTSIGQNAFRFSSKLGYVGFNGSISISDPSGVFYQTLVSSCRSNSNGYCGSCGAGKFVAPGFGCVAECWEGFQKVENFCLKLSAEEVKLRYTMQEADEATSNDNENMIEWIFE